MTCTDRDWLNLSTGRRAVPAYATTPAMVLDVVSEASGVTVTMILGIRRYRHLVRTRHIAFLILTELCTQYSKAQLADILNRDHTTFRYGVREARKHLAEDTNLRAIYDAATEALTGQRQLEAAE